MGKSLFGKLKGVLYRKKTSEISAAAPQPQATANLSRIGLGNATPYPAGGATNAPDISGFSAVLPNGNGMPGAMAQPGTAHVQPVGVQFFAEVPLQQSAEEIVNVSRRASNCLDATMAPSGSGAWSVSITLNMSPVPQEIHTVETVLSEWASKLGGISKGWGLAQGQAAA